MQRRLKKFFKNQLNSHFKSNKNDSNNDQNEYNLPLSLSSISNSKSNKKILSDEKEKNSKLEIICDLKEKYSHHKLNERYYNSKSNKEFRHKKKASEISNSNNSPINPNYDKNNFKINSKLTQIDKLNDKIKENLNDNKDFLKIEDQQQNSNMNICNTPNETKTISNELHEYISNSNNSLNLPKLNFDLLNNKENEQLNTNSIYNLILTTNNLTDVSFREDERLKLFELKLKADLKDSIFDFGIDEKINSKTLRKFLKLKTLIKEFSDILPNELKPFFKSLMDSVLNNMDYVLIYYNLNYSKVFELNQQISEMSKLIDEKKSQIENLTSIIIKSQNQKTNNSISNSNSHEKKQTKVDEQNKKCIKPNFHEVNNIKKFTNNLNEDINNRYNEEKYNFPLQINQIANKKIDKNRSYNGLIYLKNNKNSNNISSNSCKYKRNTLTSSIEKNKNNTCDKDFKDNYLIKTNSCNMAKIKLKKNDIFCNKFNFSKIDFRNYKSLIVSSSTNNFKERRNNKFNQQNIDSKSNSKSKSKSKSNISETVNTNFISSGRNKNIY